MNYNGDNLDKLRKSIQSSRRRLQPYREKRVRAIREFVGRNYSDTGSRDRVPVNMLELFISTYSRQLVGNEPNVYVRPRTQAIAPQAAKMELALNHVLREMEVAKTLRLAVIDALFSIGIVKVGVTEPAQVPMRGFLHDAGQPFAETVDLDDWVHDMSARDLSECAYMGHRFRVPIEALRDSDIYMDPDMIPEVRKTLYNSDGDIRAAAIGQSDIYHGGQDTDMAELWEIWLPRTNKICTFAAGENGMPERKIREIEWDGPEVGPYHFLSFTDVPGNTMPLPPVASLIDLHDLANRVFRKLGRQAERQKDVVGYRGSAEQDAKNVQTSSDGEVIRMDDPQNIQTYKFGGIDQQILAFILQLKNLFNYYGGNLDALGGLGPQSGTVRQDKLITDSASQRLADMQESAVNFTASVCKAVGNFIYNDNISELELEQTVKGTDIKVPFVFSGKKIEADLYDFNFEVDPYSVLSQTPGEKLQSIRELMNTFIAPLLPAMQQQGVSIDGAKLIQMVAQYSQLPELKDIFKGVAVDATQPQEVQDPTQKQTEIVRTNRPGATPRGQDDAMMRMMMAGGGGPGAQPSEAAAVGRPTG